MKIRVRASDNLAQVLRKVRRCTLCDALPLGPNPILQASASARILIAGQAPGRRAHERGLPFDDASGDRLRSWLGVDRETFYDASVFAIIPMGFCFPGTGRGGDLSRTLRMAADSRPAAAPVSPAHRAQPVMRQK